MKIVTKPKGSGVEVVEPFTHNGYTVPVGFVSDGATINPVLYTLFTLGVIFPSTMIIFVLAIYITRTSYHPRNITSAVWHDFMCSISEYEKADKGYLELLYIEGEQHLRARGKWLFVRVWHKVAYDDKNNQRRWLKFLLKSWVYSLFKGKS